jgi:hypothetical protein
MSSGLTLSKITPQKLLRSGRRPAAVTRGGVVRISYDESKIFVSVTKESILKAPQYNVRPWAFKDAEVGAVR